jgi:hypothetical protein
MDALTAYFHRNIDTIIDEKRDVVATGNGVQLLCCVHGHTTLAVLVSVLKNSDTATQRSLDDFFEVAVTEDLGR